MRLDSGSLALVGVFLTQLARCEPVRHSPSRILAGRQYLPPPLPLPSTLPTGDQPCSPNEDLYPCVEKITANYSFDTTARGTPYTMKVPVKMYNQRGYTSGNVEVDFQIKAENCVRNPPDITYQKQFNFCNSQGCGDTVTWSYTQTDKQMWGQKVGLQIGAKGAIKFLSLGLSGDASYESTWGEEKTNTTEETASYTMTLANGQVCSATTLQISAQCSATKLLYTNLVSWTSDDGSIRKMTYCGSPEAPYEQNRDFERFCAGIGQMQDTTIPVQYAGGEPVSFFGCSYS